MKLHVPRHLRNRHLLILDAVLLGLSTMLAYMVRFEGLDWGSANLHTALVYLLTRLGYHVDAPSGSLAVKAPSAKV